MGFKEIHEELQMIKEAEDIKINKIVDSLKNTDFSTKTNSEKADFFKKHFFNGSIWVPLKAMTNNSKVMSLYNMTKSKATIIGKGMTIGIVSPDKLIPGLKKPTNAITKSLAYLTRFLVAAVPGGLPIGLVLGAIFSQASPNEIESNFEESKKDVIKKLQSAIKIINKTKTKKPKDTLEI